MLKAALKTKKIAGVDLSARCFAYTGDESDTSSWVLPLFVPGDPLKTRNLIASALHRADEVKGIPDSHRAAVRLLLTGAALAHGLDVPQFAPKNEATQPAEATPAPVKVKAVEQNQVEKDPMIEAAIADADRRATALLRSLGYE